MEKLETLNQRSIINLLSIFTELGIDFEIKDNIVNEKKIIYNENNNANDKNILTNSEKRSLEVALFAKDINNLKKSFKNFEGCLLKKTATNFVGFEGNINSKILIIDGPPESAEDKEGIPFSGERGILFEKMLQSINLKRESIFIINAIPWRPPGNRFPTADEINKCKPFIFNLIYLLNPMIILCMGEVATNQILDLNKSITNSRGKLYDFKNIFLKKANENEKQIIVLPTYNV